MQGCVRLVLNIFRLNKRSISIAHSMNTNVCIKWLFQCARKSTKLLLENEN